MYMRVYSIVVGIKLLCIFLLYCPLTRKYTGKVFKMNSTQKRTFCCVELIKNSKSTFFPFFIFAEPRNYNKDQKN